MLEGFTVDHSGDLHRFLDNGFARLHLHGDRAAVVGQGQVEVFQVQRVSAIFRLRHTVCRLLESVTRLAFPR
ncbi:hypothetical protein D3C84_1221330 [compost metagenome]